MKTPFITLALLTTSATARADQPVVTETRTHGPIARHVVETSATHSWLQGPGDANDLNLYTLQLGLGPPDFRGALWDIAGGLSRWSARISTTYVNLDQNPSGRRDGWGPMTLAATYYTPVGPLDLAPLAYVHAGFEIAVGTPWLSSQEREPAPVLRDTNLLTDLSRNGWSLRPVAPYVRVDLSFCRSIVVEGGAGPELFVDTADQRASERFYMRGHVALGISLACPTVRDSLLHHVAALVQYQTRTLLHGDDMQTSYDQNLSATVQLDVGRFVVSGFYAIDPEVDVSKYYLLGLRVQAGFGARK